MFPKMFRTLNTNNTTLANRHKLLPQQTPLGAQVT